MINSWSSVFMQCARIAIIFFGNILCSHLQSMGYIQGLMSHFRNEVRQVDQAPKTLLEAVVTQNQSSVVDFLRLGCGLGQDDFQSGWTILHYAAAQSTGKIADLLIAYGAKVDARDHNDRTPLHIAVQYGNGSVMVTLIHRLAVINAHDKLWQTPFHYAAKYSPAMIPLLFLYGASLDARDRRGKTPLFLAIEIGNYHATQEILRCNPDLSRCDQMGRNILHHVAPMADGAKIVATILSMQSKSNKKKLLTRKDIYDQCPCEVAHASGNIECAGILEQAEKE